MTMSSTVVNLVCKVQYEVLKPKVTSETVKFGATAEIFTSFDQRPTHTSCTFVRSSSLMFIDIEKDLRWTHDISKSIKKKKNGRRSFHISYW